MSLFSGIQAAKPVANANYLSHGSYWLQIQSCKIKPDRKQVPMFVMDAKILRKFGAEGAHDVGEEACHLVKRDSDYWLSEIKGIIMAATGLAEDQVTEAVCEQAIQPDQPLAGIVLEYQGTQVETKASTPEDPKYFTKRFYKRVVSYKELAEGLDEAAKVRFFGATFDWKAAIAAEAG